MSTGTVRPKRWIICEQVVKDSTTGVTLRFDVLPGVKPWYRLRLGFGFQLGYREFTFDDDGKFNGNISPAPAQLKPYVPPITPSESD
jgi:hypothetical protein